MSEADPYEVQDEITPETKPQGKVTLFWTRMLRFSIYFTVFGVILGVIKYRLSLKLASSDNHADQVDALNQGIASMTTSFAMIVGFLLFGITSVIICLIMRSKELRNLRLSQNC